MNEALDAVFAERVPLKEMALNYSHREFLKSGSLEEWLDQEIEEYRKQGKSVRYVLLDWSDYERLISELGARVQYVDAKHDILNKNHEGIFIQRRVVVLPVNKDQYP